MRANAIFMSALCSVIMRIVINSLFLIVLKAIGVTEVSASGTMATATCLNKQMRIINKKEMTAHNLDRRVDIFRRPHCLNYKYLIGLQLIFLLYYNCTSTSYPLIFCY